MDLTSLQNNLDIVWIMISAALVMFMQAGFTAFESGLTRAKNSINVAMKNLLDFVLAVLIFWFCGYAMMFGDTWGGFVGTSSFGLNGMSEAKDYAIFAFQVTFAGTAVTIVSGAIAERMRFAAYAIIAVVVIALVYPISGHWIWSGDGWLAQKGFVDFAGSTVVHSLGGWVGLAGAIMLGARIGRFDKNGKPTHMQGQSLVLAVIGVLILWFGWFGFNGGSTLSADSSIALIITNTMLAAAAGGMSCFITSLIVHKGTVSIEKMLNGIVAGLVGITAGCAVVEPMGALGIGFTVGIVVFFGEELILHVFKIDDPVNVISAHGLAGAWGTMALAIFAPVENLPLKDAWLQLGVQAQGALAVFVWGFGAGLILFGLLRMFSFLRVTEEAEESGLNVHEHGASSGLLDTMKAMDQVVKAYNHNQNETGEEGDLTKRIKVDFGEEGHEIAGLFNQLMDYFHDTVYDIKKGMDDVMSASILLEASSREMNDDASEQHQNTNAFASAIKEMTLAIDNVKTSTTQVSLSIEETNNHTGNSKAVVEQTIKSIMNLADNVHAAFGSITELQNQMGDIEGILNTITEISEQTNLLALNAAIEAARAGDAGRGFAVVADEVRTLSQNTHAATNDIKQLVEQLQSSSSLAKQVIDASQKEANHTVEKAEESNTALEMIAKAVKELGEMSVNISSATNHQSEVAQDLEGNISRSLTAAEHSKVRAGKVSDTSANLHDLAIELQSVVIGLKVSDNGKLNIH